MHFTETQVDRFVARIERFARVVEFDTFWLGTHFSPGHAPAYPDELPDARRELNRRVGLRVLERLPGKVATPDDAHARFALQPDTGRVALVIEPVFIYGRYLKFSRLLPQSKWPCTRCRGPECPKCGGTGKIYRWSVEEMLAEAVMEHTGGWGTRMHAVGREDVDARMLGSGRPFVLEIGRPLRRRPDLARVEKAVHAQEGEMVLAVLAHQPFRPQYLIDYSIVAHA